MEYCASDFPYTFAPQAAAEDKNGIQAEQEQISKVYEEQEAVYIWVMS